MQRCSRLINKWPFIQLITFHTMCKTPEFLYFVQMIQLSLVPPVCDMQVTCSARVTCTTLHISRRKGISEESVYFSRLGGVGLF
ncbi:hypothetical protein GDO86_018998 [Hymenochirus boettgeri]|uniref:Uncharacterized protein n=1 Tax=Hymenochirus boettgeri TaxID=247094 RepID=A0A8T2IAP6_9PIPI|nr:hypothetical protein GDO86_018998 [Hymenochirus boettgeri]